MKNKESKAAEELLNFIYKEHMASCRISNIINSMGFEQTNLENTGMHDCYLPNMGINPSTTKYLSQETHYVNSETGEELIIIGSINSENEARYFIGDEKERLDFPNSAKEIFNQSKMGREGLLKKIKEKFPHANSSQKRTTKPIPEHENIPGSLESQCTFKDLKKSPFHANF